MNNVSNLKQQHELAVCQEFLSKYNFQHSCNYQLIRPGNANTLEPDCICSNNLSIELLGVYDNSCQAEKLWSDAQNKIVSSKANIKLCTLENLQNSIRIKLSKLNQGKYGGSSGKILLLCNLQSPLLQDHVVKNYVEEYISFRADGFFEKYFYEIWITWKSESNGSIKIQRLE
ncbi:MAG: hypothetical protein GW762_04000 [Candidatus Pacebacteria bacterium]|nr:hypothetical protein [Candidatus Paceibacterota bacterium]PIR63238.1 MAG: hypothetical protein COU64_05985 [Candidatus Pacebacteria bacterium CG10_big_fil_rev_8_21_14_0_10_40_26]PIZ78269.1 MAG: hypothetical protein COY01_05805 [Candidatus Pacebacteria bacterium CG_4_10_14_0_2_um_filter_40_20]PJA68686.1 MAG: hypothetical protein CO156_04240 [Candidatus Pacebacteria bacterium CG_4_9_14_3_um_filter_40_12]PJC41626.1 MAG: hypothetical protein CO041_02830 [Candidatus Pacebacteria bacterium CG_4_9_